MDAGTIRDAADDVSFDDRLQVFGTLAGAFVALVGVGTILGAPWATASGIAPALVQVLGALGAIALGAGLVWLVQQ
jgi:hypothetical protein